MNICSATKLHSLANCTPTMMAAWDGQLRCRFANSAYRTWFGADPVRLKGEHIQTLLGERLFALNEPFMCKALLGAPQQFERAIPGPDNIVRHSLARYLPDWENERIDGFLVEVMDVTPYKVIEQSLVERVAELEQEAEYRQYWRRKVGEREPEDKSIVAPRSWTTPAMAAEIAHELRNALSPIGTSLEAMKAVDLHGARAAQLTKSMQRQIRLTTRLLDDLIDLAGIDAGVLALKKHAVDFREVLEEALDMSLPSIEGAGHQLDIDVQNGPLPILVDGQRLAQVICNLLNNACKYSSARSEITLAARISDGHLEFSVSDSGVGMPPDSVDGIFDLFRQLPHSTSSRRGGMGIGLALVRKIVSLHGGTIRAFSAGIGKGSTFTVSIPTRLST